MGYKSNKRYELGMATGQVIGGLGLMLAGGGGATLGGAAMVSVGGAGAGAAALVSSSELIWAGAINVGVGAVGMWQSLSTGGLSGPVANGPAAPVPGAKPAAPPPPATGSQSKLAKAMREAKMQQPANTDAHHIVAQNAPDAAKSRAILQKFGIDLDNPANGVFLPSNSSSPNSAGAAVHSKLHKTDYYRAVDKALGQANTKEQAIDILNLIRQRLSAGGYP